MNRAVVRALRPRQAAAGVLGAVLLLGAGMASGEVVDLQWQDGGRFERSMAIAPGKFAELCGPLEPGQTIQWSFKSDRPVNFNIHYHVGKDVLYPAKRDRVRRAQGDLPIGVKQDYCWMWVNKRTTTAKLKVLLTRK